LLFDPPAYPTRVRTTPGRLPNRESGPQNHPMAKVAVFVSVGAFASMGGMLDATSDVVSDAVSVGTIVAFPLVEINRIATIAIPPRITVSATRLRSGPVASDGLSTTWPFRALIGSGCFIISSMLHQEF
jgi:hypothetical protein